MSHPQTTWSWSQATRSEPRVVTAPGLLLVQFQFVCGDKNSYDMKMHVHVVMLEFWEIQRVPQTFIVPSRQ